MFLKYSFCGAKTCDQHISTFESPKNLWYAFYITNDEGAIFRLDFLPTTAECLGTVSCDLSPQPKPHNTVDPILHLCDYRHRPDQCRRGWSEPDGLKHSIRKKYRVEKLCDFHLDRLTRTSCFYWGEKALTGPLATGGGEKKNDHSFFLKSSAKRPIRNLSCLLLINGVTSEVGSPRL